MIKSVLTSALFFITFNISSLWSNDDSFDVFVTDNPSYNKSDVEASMIFWMSGIVKDYHKKVKIKCRIFDNVNDVINLKDKPQNILYGTSTINYLKIKEKCKIEPVAITNINVAEGDIGERFVIAVNKKSSIKTISDLKSMKISVSGDYKSESTIYYWVNYLFSKEFGTPVSEVSKYLMIKKDNKEALMDLFLGQTDACIINKSTFNTMKKLNPQIGNKLNIIEESEDFFNTIIFMSETFDAKLKPFIIDRIFNLTTFDTGKQIRDLFKYKNIIEYNENLIKSTKKLYYESLKVSKNKR